jgi:hypothetical protein
MVFLYWTSWKGGFNMGFLGFSFCYAMAMLGYSAFLLH